MELLEGLLNIGLDNHFIFQNNTNQNGTPVYLDIM